MIDEFTPAPLGRRALAFAIDLALVLVVSIPTLIGTVGLLPAALSGAASPAELIDAALVSAVLVFVGSGLALIAQLVQLILHGRRGVTLGKKLVGIRSINIDTFERPGFGRVLLRALVLAAAGLVVPVIGAAVMLASPLWASNTRSRGWLDLVGRNWFVDIRSGLDPYDAKAVRLARKRLESPPPEEGVRVPSLATGDADAAAVFIPGPRSRSAIVGAPLPHGMPDEAVAVDRTPPPVIAPAPPPAEPVAPAASVAPAAPTAPTAPAATTAAPAAVVTGPPAATLLGSDGLRYELTGPALVGRNPSPIEGQPPIARISVADDTLSISKTHARLEPAKDGVWVLDLHSSNGSTVVNAAGTVVDCEPQVPMLAAWGSTLGLGDREFVVHRAGTLGGAHT